MTKVLTTIARSIVLLLILVLCTLIKPSNLFASDSTTAWSSTTSLPYLLASHVSFYSGNKVFVIGGSAVTGQSKFDVLSNTINSNGTLNNWTDLSDPTPTALIFHAIAVKENYVYILGGREENVGSALNHVNKVFRGTLNIQGDIKLWTQLNSLPEALSIGAATVVGNKLYFAGGFNNFGENADIYVATINPDGTIGDWANAGALPEPLSGLGLIEYNGYLIALGGQNGSGQKKNNVYKTALNLNGTIVGWQSTSSLPEPSYRAGVIKIGSQILSIGGANPSMSDKVFYADINADATLGPWSLSSNHLPQPVCCGTVASSNDHIYLTGGFNGSYLNTVYFTNIGITNSILPVPYFSQNALPWGPSEYDHAISLGFSNTTMDRWGCAVTSAAMVLNFHGMTQFSNNTALNPGTLNDWLKTHNGYLTGDSGNAAYSYLSWPAISKLTKDLFNAGKSNIKLMHKRAYPSANTTVLLNDDLNIRKFPDILYVNNASTSGHFVVAKGVLGNTYAINDPEWNVSDLSSFNNAYTQVDRYIPSNTNLSYIALVVNPEVELLLIDYLGRKTGKQIVNGLIQEFNEIPEATYTFEAPISNPNDKGHIENLGTGVNVLLIPEPVDGNYQLLASSQTTEGYTINIALFDQDGDIVLYKPVGAVRPNQDDFFDISYSQTDNTNAMNIITFQSTIDDIHEAQNENFITKESLASKLIKIIQKAEDEVLDGKLVLALRRLEQFERTINRNRGDEILETAYQILLYDVTFLKENL